MKLVTISLAVLTFLYSCGTVPYSLNPKPNYTPLVNKTYSNRPEIPIYIHFDTEPANFEYQKLGLLEITGNQTDEAILENFKYQAWEKGGNSVLFVKKEKIQTNQTATEGRYGSTNYSNHYTNRWTAIVASLSDSAYNQKKPDMQKTNYIALYEENEANTVQGSKGCASAAVGITLGVLLGIIYGLDPEE